MILWWFLSRAIFRYLIFYSYENHRLFADLVQLYISISFIFSFHLFLMFFFHFSSSRKCNARQMQHVILFSNQKPIHNLTTKFCIFYLTRAIFNCSTFLRKSHVKYNINSEKIIWGLFCLQNNANWNGNKITSLTEVTKKEIIFVYLFVASLLNKHTCRSCYNMQAIVKCKIFLYRNFPVDK